MSGATVSRPPMTAGLVTISLAELNRIAALQTRRDRKYVVDEATLDRLLQARSTNARLLKIGDSTAFRYSSVYFDTAERTLHRDAAHGRRRRYKVRSRIYQDSGHCMLEVKTKTGRGQTSKSRIDYSLDDSHLLTGEAQAFVDHSIGASAAPGPLQPVLETEYIRGTILDLESCTRLTFDRRLRCFDRSGRAARLQGIVVETKSSGPPSPADRWLWRNGIRPTRISKFCTGLAALDPELPSNRWHRAMGYWQLEV